MFTVKNLKALETNNGVAWNVDIILNNKKVGSCSNNGDGGCNRYSFKDPKIKLEFSNNAKKKFKKCFEPESEYIEWMLKKEGLY